MSNTHLTTESTALALFGASGRTGHRVIQAAAERGLPIRGLVRTPGSLAGMEGATEIVGTLKSPADIDRTLIGASAACLVFGPRPPFTELFCTAATRAILDSAHRHGIQRIVAVTGAMIGHYPANRTWPFRQVTAIYQRRQPGPHADRVEQEALIRDSGDAWTLVKPPRLTDTGRAPEIQAGPAVRVGLGSSVSRSDLADLLVHEILEPRFEHTTVFVRT